MPHNNFIWLKLPGLPLELWAKESMEKIENVVGCYIYVDPKCIGVKDKWVAWILIEKGFSGGFPESIDLHWNHYKV